MGKKTELYFKNLKDNGPIVPLVNDIDADFSGEFAGAACISGPTGTRRTDAS